MAIRTYSDASRDTVFLSPYVPPARDSLLKWLLFQYISGISLLIKYMWLNKVWRGVAWSNMYEKYIIGTDAPNVACMRNARALYMPNLFS